MKKLACPDLKSPSVISSALCVVAVLLFSAPDVRGEENPSFVETDLPQERKEANKSYYHDSTPPDAVGGIYSDIFVHKWLDAPHDGDRPIPQAAQDRISDAYIAWCRAEKRHAELGDALLYRERWEEAIAAYRTAYETAGAKKDQAKSRALYGIANAQMGAGRLDEARRTLVSLRDSNLAWGGYYNGGRDRYPNYKTMTHGPLFWLEGRRLNGMGLPRGTDQKPFPEPQEATYTETFADCARIALALKGVKADDPRVGLLRLKLADRGFAVGAAGYPVSIALDPSAIDRPEGYVLEATEKGCAIRGHDAQGVLWGVVSFIQILDPERHAIRLQTVRDFPSCPKRGFLGRCCEHDAEFMLFNKMNINTAKPAYLTMADYSPLNLYKTRQMAKDHNDFGLELYFGAGNLTMDASWPISWKVFGAMQIENFSKWAACGVGVYYPYDDARYWESGALRKEDEALGKPSDYDYGHLLRVYSAVKAKYPNFKMQFCPPFYWGPRAGHPYPDDRAKYLKSVGRLPEEISFFWTGERVGSLVKSRGDCRWYAELIGRKPSLFQNKAGRHYYQSYGPDEMPWDEWYYKGFVEEDMRSIQKNSDTPQDYTVLSTLADYCWNPSAYDRARAVRRGLDQLGGNGLYAALKPAHDVIGEVDRYKYGNIDSGVLGEDLATWEAHNRLIHECDAKAKAIGGWVYDHCLGSWKGAVGFHDTIVRAIRKPPDFRKAFATGLKNNAADLEATKATHGFDPARDLLCDPLAFRGVSARHSPARDRRGRQAKPDSRLLARIDTATQGTVSFRLSRVPADGVRMILRGGASDIADGLTIKVNGHVRLQGDGPGRKRNPLCGGKGLRFAEAVIPAEMLKEGENEVVFANVSSSGYPIFLQFAVFKNVKEPCGRGI